MYLFLIIALYPGNYDIIQQPKNVGEAAIKDVPFYMFIDEETEAYMKNSTVLDSSMKVGLWRIVVVHNVPYTDSRRNGKVSLFCFCRTSFDISFSVFYRYQRWAGFAALRISIVGIYF